ncbi:MAG: ABC transporter substrate-binding protein [Arachnia sp.]
MTPRVRRPVALLSLLASLGLLLSACTQPTSLPTSAKPVVLDIGATGEPLGLDPSTVSGAGTPFVLLYNVYETLVRLDSEGTIRPLLAREWNVSSDNLVYTFTLDREATFASGQPVNADAVVASFQRILDGTGSDTILAQMAPVESVVALDETKVEVTLAAPSNQWLYDMTGPAGIVYDPAGLTTIDTVPAGSGPFTFAEWEQGSFVKLERNDSYWGTEPRVNEVYFRYYADPNAMNTAMLSGQLDVISNLTVPESIDQFADTEQFKVLEGTTDGEVVLGFNHDTEALQNLQVRQAINYAIDREALVEAIWGGKGMLIGSMVPPTDPWYKDLSQTYPYDPERAKQLLAEAGYADGLTLRLRVPNLPYGPTAGRFIATQLREVGIEVELDELEFPARWLEVVFTQGDYDMTIVAHVEPRDLAKFADPTYYWHYDNPQFQDLVAEADAGTTDEQAQKLRQAAQLLADDAAADWLFLLPNLIITTTEVSGIEANATNLSFDLTHVSKR